VQSKNISLGIKRIHLIFHVLKLIQAHHSKGNVTLVRKNLYSNKSPNNIKQKKIELTRTEVFHELLHIRCPTKFWKKRISSGIIQDGRDGDRRMGEK
jgi:hypothetical protein